MHRGCAGFDYDTEAAKAHTMRIQAQFDAMFGEGHGTVYPLLCGFETDEDALILHGSNGRLLKVSELTETDRADLRRRIDTMFADMPADMRHDLVPLISGNIWEYSWGWRREFSMLDLAVCWTATPY